MGKLPSFQFYPGDWMKDPALRSVSLAGRGLWIDVLSLMFEASPRGYLVLNGKSVSVEQLARMVGSTADEVFHLLEELKHAGVASVTDQGCLYSRRMVRDEEIRGVRRKCGSMGGNPSLVNQNRISLTKPKPSDQAKLNQTTNQNTTPSSSSSSSSSKQNTPLPPKGGSAREIFEYWKKELNHPAALLDPNTERKIKMRLKEGHSVDRIKKAIRGIKLSPHNMGQNDRNQKFDHIELICRNGSNIERFAGLEEAEEVKREARLKNDLMMQNLSLPPEHRKDPEYVPPPESARQAVSKLAAGIFKGVS